MSAAGISRLYTCNNLAINVAICIASGVILYKQMPSMHGAWVMDALDSLELILQLYLSCSLI